MSNQYVFKRIPEKQARIVMSNDKVIASFDHKTSLFKTNDKSVADVLKENKYELISEPEIEKPVVKKKVTVKKEEVVVVPEIKEESIDQVIQRNKKVSRAIR